MTPEEAKTKLLLVLQELYQDGFDIWGFDDGSIQVYRSSDGFEIREMQHDKGPD